MDRFKFRVWDEGMFEDSKPHYEYASVYTGLVLKMATGHHPIEQCTGFKDKNGNLIYENDVLFDGEFCGQVIWKDGCWLVEMTLYDGDKYYEHLDQHFAKYGEIIGNIHEQKDNK